MVNSDIREGTLSLADPVNWSQGHASSEESKRNHSKSNRLAPQGHKPCKLSSIYSKFVVDKWLSLLFQLICSLLQQTPSSISSTSTVFFIFTHLEPIHTHSNSFRIFRQVQWLSAPQQDGASKPISGKPQIFTWGAAQPRKKIHFCM